MHCSPIWAILGGDTQIYLPGFILSLAVVLVSAERARDLKQKAALVRGYSQATGPDHMVMWNYFTRDPLDSPGPGPTRGDFRQMRPTRHCPKSNENCAEDEEARPLHTPVEPNNSILFGDFLRRTKPHDNSLLGVDCRSCGFRRGGFLEMILHLLSHST